MVVVSNTMDEPRGEDDLVCFFYARADIGIIDDHFDGNGTSPVTLIFWGMWILFFAFSFISFRRARRK